MILTTPRTRTTPTVEATDTTTCAAAKCSEGMGTPSGKSSRRDAASWKASWNTRAAIPNQRPLKHDDGARQRPLKDPESRQCAPPLKKKKRRAVDPHAVCVSRRAGALLVLTCRRRPGGDTRLGSARARRCRRRRLIALGEA